MKFHQLRHGARFRYQGRVFRKVSPLKGACEDDELQKLIPRSAEVELIDLPRTTGIDRLPDTLSGARVATMIGHHLAACEDAVMTLDPALTDAQRSALLVRLRAAGSHLLAELAADS